MLTREAMEGVYCLPPTPFDQNGIFDEQAFRENVRKLAAAGVHAVITTGSLGEFHTISWPDHQRLAKALAEECKAAGIVSVCGCSGVNTDEAIMKTAAAEKAGCDAVMNLSPYYLNLTRPELIKFWHDLAEACPNIGITIYNNPQTSQIHDVETYRGILDIKTLCGAKEAHYDWSLWCNLHRNFPELGLFTSTEPDWFIPTMKMGARGFFTMTGAGIPHYTVEIYNLCKQGLWDKALKMIDRWHEMARDIGSQPFLQGYGLGGHKAKINAFGYLRCGYMRRPFISVPKQNEEKLAEYLHSKYADMIRG